MIRTSSVTAENCQATYYTLLLTCKQCFVLKSLGLNTSQATLEHKDATSAKELVADNWLSSLFPPSLVCSYGVRFPNDGRR